MDYIWSLWNLPILRSPLDVLLCSNNQSWFMVSSRQKMIQLNNFPHFCYFQSLSISSCHVYYEENECTRRNMKNVDKEKKIIGKNTTTSNGAIPPEAMPSSSTIPLCSKRQGNHKFFTALPTSSIVINMVIHILPRRCRHLVAFCKSTWCIPIPCKRNHSLITFSITRKISILIPTYKILTYSGASSRRPSKDRYMYNVSTNSSLSWTGSIPLVKTSTTRWGISFAISLQAGRVSLHADIQRNLMS